jgi:hypothetical protein
MSDATNNVSVTQALEHLAQQFATHATAQTDRQNQQFQQTVEAQGQINTQLANSLRALANRLNQLQFA